MKFTETALPGAWIIEPEPVWDERGFFARTWCSKEFGDRGLVADYVQSAISYNRRLGTLRGLHYQAEPHGEAKLVRCSAGAIYDVVVDLRPGSQAFGKWTAVELTPENRRTLYIPVGFAHGFLTLTPETEVVYQLSECYQPESARGVRWNDPSLAIRWPSAPTVIAPRDATYADIAT